MTSIDGRIHRCENRGIGHAGREVLPYLLRHMGILFAQGPNDIPDGRFALRCKTPVNMTNRSALSLDVERLSTPAKPELPETRDIATMLSHRSA